MRTLAEAPAALPPQLPPTPVAQQQPPSPAPLPPPAHKPEPPLAHTGTVEGEGELQRQVREAILGHALSGGGLSRLFAEAGLPWDAPLADRMTAAAIKQISVSLRARGETGYSLSHEGQPNTARLASLDRYFSKLIAKRLAATGVTTG